MDERGPLGLMAVGAVHAVGRNLCSNLLYVGIFPSFVVRPGVSVLREHAWAGASWIKALNRCNVGDFFDFRIVRCALVEPLH